LKKKDDLQSKELKLKEEMQNKYGDDWKVHYQEELKAMPEYNEVERLKDRIEPQEQAINEWVLGPLANTILNFRQGKYMLTI